MAAWLEPDFLQAFKAESQKGGVSIELVTQKPSARAIQPLLRLRSGLLAVRDAKPICSAPVTFWRFGLRRNNGDVLIPYQREAFDRPMAAEQR